MIYKPGDVAAILLFNAERNKTEHCIVIILNVKQGYDSVCMLYDIFVSGRDSNVLLANDKIEKYNLSNTAD